jgi:hypothetical protein
LLHTSSIIVLYNESFALVKRFFDPFSKRMLFYNFLQNSAGMSHNVSAVYDVFAVAIKERGAFQQPQKCGWRLAWEWSAAE